MQRSSEYIGVLSAYEPLNLDLNKLGQRVRGCPWDDHDARCGGDVDYGRGFGISCQLQEFLCHEQRAFDIHFLLISLAHNFSLAIPEVIAYKIIPKVLWVHILDGQSTLSGAGIIDQDINRPKLFLDGSEKLFDLFFGPDIDSASQNFDVRIDAANFCSSFFEFLCLASYEDQGGCAGFCERCSECLGFVLITSIEGLRGSSEEVECLRGHTCRPRP